MKKTTIAALAVAAALAAGTFVIAQAPNQPKVSLADPRMDKLIQQNEQILKGQADILKALDELKTQMTQLRRRAS